MSRDFHHILCLLAWLVLQSRFTPVNAVLYLFQIFIEGALSAKNAAGLTRGPLYIKNTHSTYKHTFKFDKTGHED